MHINSTSQSRRIGLRSILSARALPAVLLLAAFAVPNRAAANPFAATTLNPSSQTAAVGTPCSVDIVLAVPAGGYVAYGIDATVNFNPVPAPPGVAAVAQLSNVMTNFNWEYVWHCHLLGHE